MMEISFKIGDRVKTKKYGLVGTVVCCSDGLQVELDSPKDCPPKDWALFDHDNNKTHYTTECILWLNNSYFEYFDIQIDDDGNLI